MLIKFYTGVKHILLEGTVSQIFDLGLSFLFYAKKRVTFDHFSKLYFLDFIK